MALYTAAVDGLATGTALKTILQLAVPSTANAKIIEFGCTFDGTSATATPVLVTLRRQTSAGTGGASLATNFGVNSNNTAFNPANEVTAQQGPSGTWTTEPTTGAVVRAWRVPPTSGMVIQFPLGQEIALAVSSWLGVVVTAAATVNCTTYLVWDE